MCNTNYSAGKFDDLVGRWRQEARGDVVMTMTSRTVVELTFLELWNTHSMNVLDVRTFWEDIARLHCVRAGGLKLDLVL